VAPLGLIASCISLSRIISNICKHLSKSFQTPKQI